MKSDFEILDIYIDEFGMCEELEKLTYLEQVLYKCRYQERNINTMNMGFWGLYDIPKYTIKIIQEHDEGKQKRHHRKRRINKKWLKNMVYMVSKN